MGFNTFDPIFVAFMAASRLQFAKFRNKSLLLAHDSTQNVLIFYVVTKKTV